MFREVATAKRKQTDDEDEDTREKRTPTPPAPVSANIWEDFQLGDAFRESRVNRADRMITNVTLCGKVSKNGRTYSDRALDDAARLYNHTPFYLDHPTDTEMRERKGVRSVLDLAGEVVNPRRVGDQVRGDLHLLEREPISSLVFALAEQMPHMAGNSHRARGMIRPGTGGAGDVVEGLAEVFAVELVTDPATTAGLFESVTQEDAMDFPKLTVAELKKQRPDLIEALVKEATATDEASTLAAENKTLKEKLATAEAVAQKQIRAELLATKLAEAKLPAVLVTDQFKAQLAEAKDAAAVDALIGERKAIAAKVKIGGGAPRSTERDLDEKKRHGDADGTSPIDESKVSEYAGKLGLRLVAS